MVYGDVDHERCLLVWYVIFDQDIGGLSEDRQEHARGIRNCECKTKHDGKSKMY